jgi:predicted LPLAT superfamily acyltransferase
VNQQPKQHWEEQGERSSRFMLALIAYSALLLGRHVMRIVLLPVVGYFLATSRGSVAAARQALSRILGRRASWRDVARSFYGYAICALDRIYLLKGQRRGLQVEVERPDEVVAAAARGGCILLVAHLGNFDVLRTLGAGAHRLSLSILLDRQQGRMFIGLLERMNPELAAHVIDAGQRGPQLVLALREALERGRMVGIMGDRARRDERCIDVQMFGATARFPEGPWLLAAALGVPVILGFGLYRGGRRYSAHFELFAERLELPRTQRQPALQAAAQRYAARVEHYARLAPYNWFNYFAFFR